MLKKSIVGAVFSSALMLFSCENSNFRPENRKPESLTLDMAQASGQLASGSSFNLSGSSTEGTILPGGRTSGGHHGSGHHHDRKNGILDGFSLLAPTPELLAIIDAESAGDLRGMRMCKIGGATVQHYTSTGSLIDLPIPEDGPHGHSFSGHENPEMDSLLALIARTEIDFGAGVTFTRDTVSITRKGKITITRSSDPATKTRTEVVTFTDYSVNDNKIFGTKTQVHTFDETSGTGRSVTLVDNGQIIFKDGTETTWTSEKTRTTQVTKRNNDHRPQAGTITTTVNTSVIDGNATVIYSHKSNTPLIEKFECRMGRRHGPVTGELETNYQTNHILINFGDGSCENRKVTVTINGVVSVRTID